MNTVAGQIDQICALRLQYVTEGFLTISNQWKRNNLTAPGTFRLLSLRFHGILCFSTVEFEILYS